MAYTKFFALFCVTSLLLTACGGMSKKEPEEEPITIGEQGQILQPITNPYLEQATTIPQGAQAQFDAALLSIKNKDWNTATKQLTAMTGAFPKLSGPYVNLGLVQWQQKDFKAASSAFSKAIEANKLNGDAYLQYALMQREQGNFSEAEDLYLQAIAIWPHNTQAHIGLGILYDMYMGLFVDAIGHYEMAQKLHSTPNRKLAGWIKDTMRRVPKVQSKDVTESEEAL